MLDRYGRRKALEEAWSAINMRLYLFARMKLYGPRMRWRGKNGGSPPSCNDEYDIVQDACKKFLEKECYCGSSQDDTLSELMNIISRRVNHLATSADNKSTVRATVNPEESAPGTVDISNFPASESSNPELLLQEKEKHDHLLSICEADEDCRKVIETVLDFDEVTRRDIAKTANVSLSTFDNARKRIQRILRLLL